MVAQDSENELTECFEQNKLATLAHKPVWMYQCAAKMICSDKNADANTHTHTAKQQQTVDSMACRHGLCF